MRKKSQIYDFTISKTKQFKRVPLKVIKEKIIIYEKKAYDEKTNLMLQALT